MAKYKLKTHKGAAKRFHVTGSGKLMRMHQSQSHLRRTKSARVKRTYGQLEPVSPSDTGRVSRMLRGQ